MLLEQIAHAFGVKSSNISLLSHAGFAQIGLCSMMNDMGDQVEYLVPSMRFVIFADGSRTATVYCIACQSS